MTEVSVETCFQKVSCCFWKYRLFLKHRLNRPSRGNSYSPGYSDLHIDGGKVIIVYTIKKLNEGRFLSKQQLINRNKSYSKFLIWPVVVVTLFPSIRASCTLVRGATVVFFIYHQNCEYLANSWNSLRRAVGSSVCKFYSIHFYIDVSTFELS